MTLTPEQFNLLVTKDEFKRGLEDAKEEIKMEIGKVLTVVDTIAKEYEDHKTEHLSNQAAHDRFEERVEKLENKGLELKIPTRA